MTGTVAWDAEVGGGDESVAQTSPLSRSRLAAARTEMLQAFLHALDAAEMPYCLLCGYQGYPDVAESDVDFMVRPDDDRRVAALLRSVAKNCGALLMQAIRHETGACYYVLAKQFGNKVAYLHPDCSADYRRNGRLWLRAEDVLARRCKYKTFYAPAAGDEFLYYIIKKVLKQYITGAQLQRLRALYLSSPLECCERMRQLWSRESVRELTSALVKHDIERIRLQMLPLLEELRASDAAEGWFERGAQHLREWRRILRRVANPSGLRIGVGGGSALQRAEFAAALEQNLGPAFRRTQVVREEDQGWRSATRQWIAAVRSTLVIRLLEEAQPRGWGRSEIYFDLSAASNRDVEHSTRVVLHRMAGRLEQRFAGRKASQNVADLAVSVRV